MATGWDNGLNQDYCRKLAMWFASRLGAREDVRKAFVSNVKNKQLLFAVMRHDQMHNYETTVCCCITRTKERAEELCGVYKQELVERGIGFSSSFYVHPQTYYDE